MARSSPKSAASSMPNVQPPTVRRATPAAASAASNSRRKAPAAARAPAQPQPGPVRGSFKLPKADYDRIAALKARMRAIGHPAKKNALLRVGLLMLSALSDDTLRQLLDQLPPARPAKADRRSKRAPD